MRQFLIRLFQGRYGSYGTDMLTRFLLFGAFLCFLLSVIAAPLSFFYYIAIVLLIYCYFRLFSKNITRRYKENERYLSIRRKITGLFKKR